MYNEGNLLQAQQELPQLQDRLNRDISGEAGGTLGAIVAAIAYDLNRRR